MYVGIDIVLVPVQRDHIFGGKCWISQLHCYNLTVHGGPSTILNNIFDSVLQDLSAPQ